jgi:hypothetical protein
MKQRLPQNKTNKTNGGNNSNIRFAGIEQTKTKTTLNTLI